MFSFLLYTVSFFICSLRVCIISYGEKKNEKENKNRKPQKRDETHTHIQTHVRHTHFGVT